MHLYKYNIKTQPLRKAAIGLLACGVLTLGLTGCGSAIETGGTIDEPPALETSMESADASEVTPTQTHTPTPTPSPTPSPTPVPSPTPTPDIGPQPPNEVGQIMIIMYHGITKGKPPSSYQRSVEGLRSDLTNLYEKGYRLMKLSDLINNNITVNAGYSPVVITFDDGMGSSFSLQESDKGLIPSEDCGLDVIEKFATEHPDFGKTAAFFINGASEQFKGAGTLKERLKFLIDNGYEVGSHSYTHDSMANMNAEKLQAAIGRQDQYIRELLPGYEPVALAYPYGARPGKQLWPLVLDGTYNGTAYKYRLAVRAGISAAKTAPNAIGYDPLNTPRVRGSDEMEGDLGWFIRHNDAKPQLRYVSDGNPNTVTVPQAYEEMVNKESLGGKELVISRKK